MAIKFNLVLVAIAILMLGFMPYVYAHSFDYQHGYNAGQQGGRNGLLNLAYTCEGYNFNDCAAGYSDGFFSTCKPLMSNDTQGCYDDAGDYEYGYKMGKLDAVSSLSNPVGRCSAIDAATQQEIDSCHQGYNYAYNHFCGIHGRIHSEYPCDDHTHTLAYIIGYNNAVQDEVNSVYNPPGDCSMETLGDNATHKQIEKCLQGYQDSYNYFCATHGHANSRYPCLVKYSVPSFSSTTILLKIAYNIGYEYGKVGVDFDCDSSFMGDNTTQQQMDRCEKGISDAYNQFCVHGTPHEKSQCSEE